MNQTKKTKLKDNSIKVVNDFFRNPKVLIIILSFICLFLILFVFNTIKNNKIFIGEVKTEELIITDIHCFTNNNMNFFYANNAYYLGEDKEIYAYEIGYYVEYYDDYISFLTRKGELDEATSLKDVVNELSRWKIGELHKQNHYFKKKIINNINNLHFIIKARTSEENGEWDIVLDKTVDITKLTK